MKTKISKIIKMLLVAVYACIVCLNISANPGLSSDSPFLFDSSPPVIEVWYGDNQVFGNVGTPQEWINILGHVSDPDSGVSTLTYQLNGVTQSPNLSFEAWRRIQNDGDFNIEIDKDNLIVGSNTVRIFATNTDGVSDNVLINFEYYDSNTWYLPYSIGWDTVSDSQDVVQIVDGYWETSTNGIRSVGMGYDRVVAIGDMIWQDYEIKVPITIHDIDEDYYGSWPSTNPGIGLILHWLGHTDDPVVCTQPHCGWLPNGAFTWFEFKESLPGVLQISTDDSGSTTSTALQLSAGNTYWFKSRVEKNTSGNLYKLKVWQGSTEPPAWTLTLQSGLSNLDHGSVILVAHHVDATFGDVTITPLNGDLTLTLTADHGDINTDRESPYQYGEKITLTAEADSGWVFDHWSGDLSGSENPETIIMTGDQAVTAVFEEASTYTLITQVSPSESGSITKDPNKSGYIPGETVQLTAVENAGFSFSHWSGSISSTENPVSFQIHENMNVTATFTQDEYTFATNVSPEGAGSVAKDPDQSTYHYDDEVDLTATAAAGYSFDSWSGDASGTLTTTSVTVQGNTSVTANFTQDEYTITKNIVPALGGDFTIDPEQTTYHYGDIVTVTAVPSTGYAFTSWGDAASGTNLQTQVTITGNTTITANFAMAEYTIDTISVHGTVTLTPNQSTYHYGDEVTIEATPNSGWYFSFWSGDFVSTENPYTFTVNGNLQIIANFTETPRFTLDVSISPSNSGCNVLIEPDLLNYESGKTVTLTPLEAEGWEFDQWNSSEYGSANPLVLQMDNNIDITAIFTEQYYTLDIISEHGTVITTPNQTSYLYNTPIEVTAKPQNGWVFSHWEGDLNTSLNPADFSITDNMQIIAVYKQYEIFIPMIIK